MSELTNETFDHLIESAQTEDEDYAVADDIAELDAGLDATNPGTRQDELEALAAQLEDNEAEVEAAAEAITDDHTNAVFDDIEDVNESDRLRMEWGHETKNNIATIQQFVQAHPKLKAAVMNMQTIDANLLRAGLELARQWKR